MKKVKFQKLTGFRDFYPEEMAGRKWLFSKMSQVSQQFGYQEYEGPILEPLALYAAKSGEELVKKQTFSLKDRSGQEVALRPEMTPSLARIVAQKQEELTFPLRWFNIGPRWRYEKPQKGRTREFYQWDVDLLGWQTAAADAEVIALAAAFLKAIGLSPKQVTIKINDRKLMEQKLDLISVPSSQITAVFRAIDKKEKMAETEWDKYLKEIGLDSLQTKDLKKILKDKDFSRESEELLEIFSTLTDLGLADYAEFDPLVTRGLDYYTGPVFEARDKKGEFRAILGGGRYDNLVKIVGGQPLPGVGFACGDVVLEEVLRKYKKWPVSQTPPAQVLITLFDESFYRQTLKIAAQLRKEKIKTEVYLEPDKLDKQLKYAERKGIPFVIIFGPKEEKKEAVTLKDMAKKQQETVSLKSLPKKLRS